MRGRFFHVRDVAVDGRGRLLVFGYQIDNNNLLEGPGVPDLVEQNAVVFRLLPDGRRDPSFGSGRGFVRSGFGLESAFGNNVPLVAAMTGTVDSADRPVLVAGVEAPYSPCYGKGEPAVQPRAVVRLTQSGEPDTTFGEGGVSHLEGAAGNPQIAIAADGTIQASIGGNGSRVDCRGGNNLVRIGPDGQRVSSFGSDGVQAVGRRGPVGFQPSGAAILGGGSGRDLLLERLLSDGRRDHGFGRSGVARVRPRDGADVGVAGIDRKGRIVLFGLNNPPHRKGHRPPRDRFVVGRLRADGELDRGFGTDGWVTTNFPRRLQIRSVNASLDSRGRLVVAGVTGGWGESHGFVVARYLMGSQ